MASYFRGTRSLDGFNNAFSSTITERATLIAPLSLYALGLIRKDSKMKTTAMLAAQAVASSEIVTTVFKDIDRRTRPIAISENASFADSWFKDNTRYLHSNGSFPSGHTIAAFSIATVFSRRYGKTHR